MKLEIKGNKALNGEIASPETEVLTFAEGLTEEARSAIVRDHNIGVYARKQFEDGGIWAMDLWQVAGLLPGMLRLVAKENREHHARCRRPEL